jgi:hypothetical protein
MEPRATVVRASDGTEKVLLELADFQALLDAADVPIHGLPDIESLVRRLRLALDQPSDGIGLEDFLAEYDALHGKG